MMSRRRFVWLMVAIITVSGLVYLLRSQLSGTPSAWILWEKTMTTKGDATTTTWEPLDGFDRLSDCHQSGQEIIKAALDFMNSGGRKVLGVRPDGRSAVYSEGGPQDTVDTRLLCFPGPFDPRVSQP
jgi:hypothetical protein